MTLFFNIIDCACVAACHFDGEESWVETKQHPQATAVSARPIRGIGRGPHSASASKSTSDAASGEVCGQGSWISDTRACSHLPPSWRTKALWPLSSIIGSESQESLYNLRYCLLSGAQSVGLCELCWCTWWWLTISTRWTHHEPPHYSLIEAIGHWHCTYGSLSRRSASNCLQSCSFSS